MNTIKISRFKCFEADEFELNKVTLLTGTNGAGKSSLIQALLLCRIVIERMTEESLNGVHNCNDIPLNEEYQLKLGEVNDIIRESKSNHGFEVIIDKNRFHFDTLDESNISLKCDFTIDPSSVESFWNRKEFYYLHAERLGPRQYLESGVSSFLNCGQKGELVAYVLNKIERIKGFTSALFKGSSLQFEIEVNKWLETVCPGISVGNNPLTSTLTQLKIKGPASKSDMLATNIGFGVSYVLPIIVTGLIAKKDSIIIVENPEAHLHPKGQSNIGYFLGKVANAGVRILIETHSEHVVNGMRRAALDSYELSNQDINIYFFNGFDDEKKIDKKLIRIKPNGDLTDFPEDFFDQTRQDLLAIIKANKK